VIIVTRLNGAAFAVNPDLIERAESTPDTVVTLVDGTKYVLAEPLERLNILIRDYRASVIAAAHVQATELLYAHPPPRAVADADDHAVVVLHQRER
jgi:flagellar protein FlbD